MTLSTSLTTPSLSLRVRRALDPVEKGPQLLALEVSLPQRKREWREREREREKAKDKYGVMCTCTSCSLV